MSSSQATLASDSASAPAPRRRGVRRDVPGDSHDHRLVECVHALIDTPESNQHPTTIVQANRLKVTVTKPKADVEDLFGQRERRLEIAPRDCLVETRAQQPAVHNARWLPIQESFGSPQPSGGDRTLDLLRGRRDQGERGPRGVDPIT